VPNSPKLLRHHSNPFEIKSFAFGFPHLDELNSLYCQDQHSLSIYLRARWFVPSSSSIYNLPRFDSTNYRAVYINAPLSNRGGQLSLNHPNADITLFVAVCCNISKFAKVSTTSFTCYYTIVCTVVIVLSYLTPDFFELNSLYHRAHQSPISPGSIVQTLATTTQLFVWL